MIDEKRASMETIEREKEEMVALVRAWSEINSGSDNLEGLSLMREELKKAFGSLGGEIREIDLPERTIIDSEGNEKKMELGKALHISKRPSAKKRIFLCGHMDTVFGADHSFQKVEELKPGVFRGPGVSDLKGGLVIMLKALEALERSEHAEKIGWEVVINPDEEIGSIGSENLIRDVAKKCAAGLIFEPSLPDGAFVSARKGSGNYAVVVRGKAAHVGREYELGRNAIVLLAEFIQQVDALRSDSVVVNVGEIEGGGPVNVVPSLAIARFNIRVEDQETFDDIGKRLTEIENELSKRDGLSLKVHCLTYRNPKPFDEATQELFERVRKCSEELSFPCSWRATGGVCDGNVAASVGVPTIDTLGARGGKIHTSDEFIELDSLVERTQLTTRILESFASD